MTLKRYAIEPYMTLTRYPWRYCSDFYPLHLAVILIELCHCGLEFSGVSHGNLGALSF